MCGLSYSGRKQSSSNCLALEGCAVMEDILCYEVLASQDRTTAVSPFSNLGFARPVGARCSSVVRAFAHGAMGRRIDPSLRTH